MRFSKHFSKTASATDTIPIAVAFGLFRLKMNEEIKPSVLKKRYQSLIKKHHPDVGGNAKDFELIQRSYKLLRKYDASQMNANILFHRIGPEEGTSAQILNKSNFDWFDFAGILSLVCAFAFYTRARQSRVVKACSSKEDETSPKSAHQKSRHSWHVWQNSSLRNETFS
mmetsp:Transcript_6574/g.9936  ORF Transcript_6574/g.9936 Transcript_6574/m.9936 type:complete len:169 (-) Transcript_6574:17-523(-)